MNTSFGNRYANTYFSPNNKGEAMRKMRQGVRLPGWGLPMNGVQTRSATYLNQHSGSPEFILNELDKEITRQEEATKKGQQYFMENINRYIRELQSMDLTIKQKMCLKKQIDRADDLPNLQRDIFQKKGFIPLL